LTAAADEPTRLGGGDEKSETGGGGAGFDFGFNAEAGQNLL
jgi:hypothetical protein